MVEMGQDRVLYKRSTYGDCFFRLLGSQFCVVGLVSY